MNERIKQVRKELHLTQDDLANKLNISKNFVWMIEKGDRLPSDRTIKDFCREFGVNENWLRTGEGQMIEPLDRNAEIAKLVANMKRTPDSMKNKLTLLLQQVDDETITLMYNIAKQWVEITENKEE